MSYQTDLPDWDPSEDILLQDLDPTATLTQDIGQGNIDLSDSGDVNIVENALVQSTTEVPALELLARNYYYQGIFYFK